MGTIVLVPGGGTTVSPNRHKTRNTTKNPHAVVMGCVAESAGIRARAGKSGDANQAAHTGRVWLQTAPNGSVGPNRGNVATAASIANRAPAPTTVPFSR